MTDKKNKEALDERFESSFNVNASVPDPIDFKDNHRPADKDQKDPPKSMTKAQMVSGITHASYKLSHPELTAKYQEFFKMGGGNISAEANRATIKAGGLKEDMDVIFEGADLSEEFKDKATTIFEAAVNTAILNETARLEEEFEARLDEAMAEQAATLEEAVNKYMDHVAAEWFEENRLQVETGLRADISESFLAGLKSLFEEHYVDIPEDKVDVVEGLTTRVEELVAALNESKNEALELQKIISEQKASEVLAVVSEDLTDTQREKLALLAEDIDFVDPDSYKQKLTTIVEGLIAKPAVKPADQQLNEEMDLATDTKPASTGRIDPLVAAAVAAAKKHR